MKGLENYIQICIIFEKNLLHTVKRAQSYIHINEIMSHGKIKIVPGNKSRVCSRWNREWEFPEKWAKNQHWENREMETETEFGNLVGIFACKTRSRLSDKNLNNLLFLKKNFSGI